MARGADGRPDRRVPRPTSPTVSAGLVNGGGRTVRPGSALDGERRFHQHVVRARDGLTLRRRLSAAAGFAWAYSSPSRSPRAPARRSSSHLARMARTPRTKQAHPSARATPSRRSKRSKGFRTSPSARTSPTARSRRAPGTTIPSGPRTRRIRARYRRASSSTTWSTARSSSRTTVRTAATTTLPQRRQCSTRSRRIPTARRKGRRCGGGA